MEREQSEQPKNASDSEERADANERRSGYLGFVAHEVRNPLSTALWTAELLARMSPEERGGARGDKLSAMCLRSLSRVRQLVEDHFLCERLDVAGIPVRAEPLSLGEILEGLLERRPADAPPVTVELDGPITVAADRSLLERAIEALLAVAGSEGTPVRVVARTGEDVSISVSGHAVPPEALEDPRKGSPSDPKGRALALPVARRAAGALHGSLALSEDGYLLTLPRVRAYTAPPDSPREP
ncbi:MULTISPECIES: sensor histidine kinase KdpD [Anaeromyxobacter]|uniref:sensor histidine kinase n=1 Tax=Anaeromyxobacter TaxID=161492 RepID=UPI001F59313B|nr:MULTISPECIES: HAMP domain-containing sensor histidine kinase [unclassified Anaeromyxobacter]